MLFGNYKPFGIFDGSLVYLDLLMHLQLRSEEAVHGLLIVMQYFYLYFDLRNIYEKKYIRSGCFIWFSSGLLNLVG